MTPASAGFFYLRTVKGSMGVHKGLPEAASNARHTYKDEDNPASNNPNENSKIPHKRDDNQGHKKKINS
jgi:hypothetical protein